ncbi:MAG TPA: hypothetical protein VK864_01160, partial [Longimicrobiales bacterium]|nr:hypothetical protein [Longimicrobiales bacterium]
RNAHDRAARALAWFLVFAAAAQAVALGGSGYPGPWQELIASTLRGLGFSQRQLVLVFAEPAWPAWLALGALVRFSILFPEPLSASAVEQSGGRDRTGMMRSVPGAGVDIGQAARLLLATLLRRGWLEARPVSITAAAGALLSIVLEGSPLEYVLWTPFGLILGIAISALRAGFVTCGRIGQQRVRWLARASLTAAGLFGLSAASALARSEAGSVLVSVLLTLAPLAILVGLAMAVLLPDPPHPRPDAA